MAMCTYGPPHTGHFIYMEPKIEGKHLKKEHKEEERDFGKRSAKRFWRHWWRFLWWNFEDVSVDFRMTLRKARNSHANFRKSFFDFAYFRVTLWSNYQKISSVSFDIKWLLFTCRVCLVRARKCKSWSFLYDPSLTRLSMKMKFSIS